VTGVSAMFDEIAYALTPIEPGGTGSVRTHGEIWTATADEPIEAGSPVRVTAVNGLLLRVTPAAKRIET
jgi:membrane-bound ClpP family serine protease